MSYSIHQGWTIVVPQLPENQRFSLMRKVFAMREYALNQSYQEFYGLIGGLRRMLSNLLKRRMLKGVHELDDHILRDIGLNRDQVASVLHLPLRYDPIAELQRRIDADRRRFSQL